jgi:hypothetical protein
MNDLSRVQMQLQHGGDALDHFRKPTAGRESTVLGLRRVPGTSIVSQSSSGTSADHCSIAATSWLCRDTSGFAAYESDNNPEHGLECCPQLIPRRVHAGVFGPHSQAGEDCQQNRRHDER